jgi:hypothetical protein
MGHDDRRASFSYTALSKTNFIHISRPCKALTPEQQADN